jgi:CheY-like chemotaxis protein
MTKVVTYMAFSILVVDDNDMNLVLLAKILELEGYQVTKAHNAMEAIQAALKKMPDLALLDVMMPEMDGYELCRRMRQPPFNPEIPIVMLTAMNSDGEQAAALKAGANEVWSKPFDMETFRQRIGKLVKNNPSAGGNSFHSPI